MPTRTTLVTTRTEPECYAPTGKRTFVRLFPNDYHQAAPTADLAIAGMAAWAAGGARRGRLLRTVEITGAQEDSALGTYAFDAHGDVISSDAAAGFSLYRVAARDNPRAGP